MTAAITQNLLQIKDVRQAFTKNDGKKLLVLEGVNLELHDKEIVALLGKSGSGKSTLLRIIAGLIEPSSGEVVFEGDKVTSLTRGISMVFQTFALFPWLTVLENVELGLEAQGLPEKEVRRRALEAIDLIGLDGYESAYPRELSGGMKQRVGFARAIVVNPEILLMDEPFSALDVLTAETLKTDFLDLWLERKIPIRSVLMVTHNIEEAVVMADRILIFSSNPGHISSEIRVNLPYPRDRLAPEFVNLVEEIYSLMTAKVKAKEVIAGTRVTDITLGERLPRTSPNQLAGLMEEIAAPPYNGHADLPALDNALQMSTEELFQIIEALRILRFAEVDKGDITLTEAGKKFVAADTQKRKSIFAEQLLKHIPLATYIKRVLNERPGNRANRMRFLTKLEDFMNEAEAREVMTAITSWGRYAEIFSYDDNSEVLSLENPTAED